MMSEDVALALHLAIGAVERGRLIGPHGERATHRAMVRGLRPAHLVTIAEQGCQIRMRDTPETVFLRVIDVVRSPDPAGRRRAPGRSRGEPMTARRLPIGG